MHAGMLENERLRRFTFVVFEDPTRLRLRQDHECQVLFAARCVRTSLDAIRENMQKSLVSHQAEHHEHRLLKERTSVNDGSSGRTERGYCSRRPDHDAPWMHLSSRRYEVRAWAGQIEQDVG